MNRNVYIWEEDFERRAEIAEASSKLSAAEEHKAQVWRKRFCVFLYLLFFAILCGALKYWP